VLFALQIVVGLLPETPTDHDYKYLPAPAGIAVTARQGPDSASSPPWAGFCLLCLYTAIVLGLAARRVHRRDA
jgi:ABC-2 type transport system permease protein